MSIKKKIRFKYLENFGTFQNFKNFGERLGASRNQLVDTN
jgi:hypothetical protein